jgi:hypothetical protein
MKKIVSSAILSSSAIVVLFVVFSFVEKHKFLEGKKFNVQFYEVKVNGRGKALPSVFQIKNGKIQDELMEEKLTVPPMNYTVTLDSTYVEDETEMHMVTFEGAYTEDKDSYKWEATVINYDIEGTLVQMKGDVEKKRYEFSGSEKPKK